MPRLTDKDYLKRHHFLAELWESPLMRPIFQKLEVQEQLDLHIYYQTSKKASDEELLRERAEYGPESSLPQKAGRAWNSLLQLYVGNCRHFGIDVSEKDPRPSVKRFHSAIQRKDPQLRKRYAVARKITAQPPGPGQPKRSHRVEALVKADFDMEGFAKALLLLAMHNQEEEAKRGKGPKPDDT